MLRSSPGKQIGMLKLLRGELGETEGHVYVKRTARQSKCMMRGGAKRQTLTSKPWSRPTFMTSLHLLGMMHMTSTAFCKKRTRPLTLSTDPQSDNSTKYTHKWECRSACEGRLETSALLAAGVLMGSRSSANSPPSPAIPNPLSWKI